jgi:GH43 family beta-xylosidase
MITHGDVYYMAYSVGGTHVEVNRANNVAGPWPSAGTLVYQPPSDLHELWAPELHRIGSSWYVYVSMDDGGNGNHRMRVLKGTDDNDPTKPFAVSKRLPARACADPYGSLSVRSHPRTTTGPSTARF